MDTMILITVIAEKDGMESLAQTLPIMPVPAVHVKTWGLALMELSVHTHAIAR